MKYENIKKNSDIGQALNLDGLSCVSYKNTKKMKI